MRIILQEIGVEYQNCEPLVRRIEELETKNKGLINEVQELKEKIKTNREEIEIKNKEIAEGKEKMKEYEILIDDIKGKNKIIIERENEIDLLKERFAKFKEKNNENLKVFFYLFAL